MACPLFLPLSRLTGFAPEATTLGDLYCGECAADPGALIPADTLRRCCNAGYARGDCARAALSDADAVRFLVKSDANGVVEVAWSLERDHHPVNVGTTQMTEEQAGSKLPLDRQLRAYVAAYVRQQPAKRPRP